MRKLLAMLCAMALAVSVSACGNDTKDYSNQTVMGKVVSVDGDSVTLQIALMDMPEGMEGSSGNMPQGQMPNGENGISPVMPNGGSGTAPQAQTPPNNENGSMPEMPAGGEMPDSALGGGNGEKPPQNGEMSDMFADNGEEITISLEEIAIKIESGGETTDGTKEDIKEDAMVAVEFGDKNTAKTITVKMQGGSGMRD